MSAGKFMQRRPVLFLTTPIEDYLSDSLLIGLKQHDELLVVDFPKRESLYRSFGAENLARIYGKGCTLYGNLDDEPVDRENVLERLAGGQFAAVVIGNMWLHWPFIVEHRKLLKNQMTALLDGADTPRLVHQTSQLIRQPSTWFLSRFKTRFPIFKRELSIATARLGIADRIAPNFLLRALEAGNIPAGIHPTAFSIPEQKIVATPPAKTKDFPTHIVDAEVAKAVSDTRTSYAFDGEAEYYHDLQTSRFGVTTKRSGWDCMRHYEIAANGALICFRDLNRKPPHCAPHGLIAGENCISYSSAENLFDQTRTLTGGEYDRLQRNCIAWAHQNTCRHRADSLLITLDCPVRPLSEIRS